MYGLLFSEVCLFVYCVIKRIVDRAPSRYLYTRMRLRLWLPKARKVISSCSHLSPSQLFFAGPSSGFNVLGRNTFLEGNIFFILCLKQFFLSQQNLGGHKKYGSTLLPNAPYDYYPGPSNESAVQQERSILHCKPQPNDIFGGGKNDVTCCCT